MKALFLILLTTVVGFFIGVWAAGSCASDDALTNLSCGLDALFTPLIGAAIGFGVGLIVDLFVAAASWPKVHPSTDEIKSTDRVRRGFNEDIARWPY